MNNQKTGMLSRKTDTNIVNKDQEIVKEIGVTAVPEKTADPAKISDDMSKSLSDMKNKLAGQKQAVPVNKPLEQKPAGQPAAPNQPAGGAKPAAVNQDIKVNTNNTLDDLCKAYIDLFKQHFGIVLNSSIVFENIRRLCEIDTKESEKSIYFLENTYRLSTLIYLASNLPILFVATILAEGNRKTVLKYVTAEVEAGAKKKDELIVMRKRIYLDKYKDMSINDVITITIGVTSISPELKIEIAKKFEQVCVGLKRFNNEMTNLVAKFSEDVLNDVVYIYSNFWYFLQAFENQPAVRSYVMKITDDTRKNLKI